MTSIVSTPVLGWCWSCGRGWTPQEVAVEMRATNSVHAVVCGDCIAQAFALVADEQARRMSDEQARRGEP